MKKILSDVLSCVPIDGSKVGRLRVKTTLSKSYSEDQVHEAIEELIIGMFLKRGRGRGGTLCRREQDSSPAAARPMPGSVEQNRALLLNELQADGSPIGNLTLIKRLKGKLDKEEYWGVRDSLVDDGRVGKGKGKGGSVYRKDLVAIPKATKDKRYRKERDLYEPFRMALAEFWSKDQGIKQFVVADTSSQGSKQTGGMWTRPDATLVAVRSFEYVPGKFLEVVSFELKKSGDIGVNGVYEAASHSAFAHRSYLAAHNPTNVPDPEVLDRVRSECERFGVGLILFEDPANWGTYSTEVEARQQTPPPQTIDSFIRTQIPARKRTEIAEMIR